MYLLTIYGQRKPRLRGVSQSNNPECNFRNALAFHQAQIHLQRLYRPPYVYLKLLCAELCSAPSHYPSFQMLIQHQVAQ